MKREAKGWCVHCGALRAARGKGQVELGQGEAGGSNLIREAIGVEAEVKGKGKGKGKSRAQAAVRGKRRRVDGPFAAEILPHPVDDSSSFERAPSASSSAPLLATLAGSAPDASVATPPLTATTPRATPTPQRRLNDCDTCGTPYSRPSPLKMKLQRPALPAARVLRKRNSTVALGSPSLSVGATVTDVFGGAKGSSGSGAGSAEVKSAEAAQPKSQKRADIIGVGTTEKPIPVAESSSFSASSALAPAPTAQSSVSSAPLQTTAKHPATHKTKQAPPFRYIPSTPSALPSYPPPSSQPPVRPEPTRASSSTGQIGAAHGQHGNAEGRGSGSGVSAASSAATARKKSKKSGLAKLLAQSKERDQSASGGNWGFG